jgi:subtilisin-like proprotein convertase family protein
LRYEFFISSTLGRVAGLSFLLCSHPLIGQSAAPVNPRLASREVASQGLTARASHHTIRRVEVSASEHAKKLSKADLDAAMRQIQKITSMSRTKVMPPVPDDPAATQRFGAPINAETRPSRSAISTKSPIVMAPTDITVTTNTSLIGVGSAGFHSQIAEPSAAEGLNGRVLYTSNWFAGYSTDGGATFTQLSPFTLFPSTNGGFCCDQDAIYDPHTGLYLWYLQYINDANGNIGRLAFTTDPSGTWQYMDLRPDDVAGSPFSATDWFDYPHLALSNNYVYISSNVFNSSSAWVGAQLVRVHLGELRSLTGGSGALAAGSVTSERIWSTTTDLYTPSQGSTTTVYAFSHITNASLRVTAWPESSGTATITDVAHQSFIQTGYNCSVTGVTSSNACARMDTRPYVSWVNNGKLGILWPAAQGTDALGTFAYPYVRALVLNESDKSIVREFAIYATDRAYFFASGATNADGSLGGTLGWAGGTFNPSFGVYIADGASGGPVSFPDFQIATVTGGTGDQPNAASSQRWGDYSRTRISTSNPYQWVGTHFNLKGASRPSSGSGSTDPRYLAWRRDLPTATPPVITVQPTNQTVINTRSATFGVLAAGPGSLTYQWKKNGTAIGGATSPLYTTPATALTDSGAVYTVDVTNTNGTVTSSSATLTVTAPIAVAFSNQPASVTAAVGYTATFSVVTTGSGPITYQWRKNGVNIPGATSSIYTTPALTTGDHGSSYSVVATGLAGPTTSASAMLSVLTLGSPTSGSNNTGTLISDPPAPAIEIPLTISGVTGTVGEVTLSLYLTHTFVADLKVSLVAPDSTEIILAESIGGNASNPGGAALGTSCSAYAVFSDLATAAIQTQTSASLPLVGSFKPKNPLAGFNGKSPNGTWKLRIQDLYSGDTGMFQCATLTVKPFGPPPGPSLDINADAAIDVIDLLEFIKLFGSTAPADLAKADFNSDGVIDELDLAILLAGI